MKNGSETTGYLRMGRGFKIGENEIFEHNNPFYKNLYFFNLYSIDETARWRILANSAKYFTKTTFLDYQPNYLQQSTYDTREVVVGIKAVRDAFITLTDEWTSESILFEIGINVDDKNLVTILDKKTGKKVNETEENLLSANETNFFWFRRVLIFLKISKNQ